MKKKKIIKTLKLTVGRIYALNCDLEESVRTTGRLLRLCISFSEILQQVLSKFDGLQNEIHRVEDSISIDIVEHTKEIDKLKTRLSEQSPAVKSGYKFASTDARFLANIKGVRLAGDRWSVMVEKQSIDVANRKGVFWIGLEEFHRDFRQNV